MQGFSRRQGQGSPLKQIRGKTPDTLQEEDESKPSQKEASPKKTYFGGSPCRGSPFKSTPPATQAHVSSPSSRSSPAKPVRISSPLKSASPAPAVSSPIRSVVSNNSNLRSRRSPSPMKSTGYAGSPRSEPVGKPVSAIRMRFEGGGGCGGAPQGKTGPPKPDRTRFKPYTHAPTSAQGNVYKSSYGSSSSSSSSPVKKYNFGESEKDPSCLSVAERARLFERSKFAVAAPKKPVITEAQQPKTANIFTSSPCADNFKPQEIDVSSVVPPPAEQEFVSPTKKRLAPLPPAVTSSPTSYGKGPAPPPPPPMPTTSTPTNAHSKRRSSSPARSFPKEQHSVKRIKVNAPKPGNMYPSLTDIETETETEVEGHCTDVDSMDDSIGSEQSLGAEIETIAKACSPIRHAGGARMPSRYRPSEDVSFEFGANCQFN